MNQLILLPGALGYKAQFLNLETELSSLNISAMSIDLPAHGLIPYSTQAITVPLMAEALIYKLDDLGITDPVDIFGHSLGGYLGVYLCLNFPKRVKSVFTLGTKWHWNAEISQKETSLLNPEIMEQKIPEFVEKLIASHGIEWKGLVKSIAFLMNDLGLNDYLDPLNLDIITHPARISLGDRDAMVSIAETEKVYRALTNGQFQVYPKTPHPFEKSDMRKLAVDLKEFLGS